MQPKLLDNYLTLRELAAELGISLVTLNRWLAVGYAPPLTYVGRSPYFSRESVARWLREQEGKRARGRAIIHMKTASPARSSP